VFCEGWKGDRNIVLTLCYIARCLTINTPDGPLLSPFEDKKSRTFSAFREFSWTKSWLDFVTQSAFLYEAASRVGLVTTINT